MTTREYIKNEIDVLPVSALDAVQAFVAFLLYRYASEAQETNSMDLFNPQALNFKKQIQSAQKLAIASGLTKLDIKKSIRTVRQKTQK
jgi:hypothetical protein